MSNEVKISISLGIILGCIFLLSSFLEQTAGAIISVLACVFFGPLTVWKFEHKPNIYALVVSIIAGIFLVVVHGIEIGGIYTLGVMWLYGIMSVQISKAFANSYDNVLYIVSKLRNKR